MCLQNPRHEKINMVLPKNISAKGCNSILFGVVIFNRIISVVKPKPRWTWWKRYHILFRTTTIWYFSGFQFMLGVGLVNLQWTGVPSRGSQILSSAKHNRNNYWAFWALKLSEKELTFGWNFCWNFLSSFCPSYEFWIFRWHETLSLFQTFFFAKNFNLMVSYY